MDSAAVTLEEPRVLREFQARATQYREVAYPADGVHPSHLSKMMRRYHRCTVAGHYVPALAPPIEPVTRDTEPTFAAGVAELVNGLAKGRIGGLRLTEQARAGLEADLKAGFFDPIPTLGPLRRVELLERRSEKGEEHRRYRLRYVSISLFATFVTNPSREVVRWSLSN